MESRYLAAWFLDTRGLARTVLSALKEGDVRFSPDRWSKLLASKLKKEHVWCLSRHWDKGPPLPLGRCLSCEHKGLGPKEGDACVACRKPDWVVDGARLDPWFLIWLWPLTVRCPDPGVEWPGPIDFLAADPATLHLWVGRSLMAGFFFAGSCPVDLIHIHSSVWKEADDEKGAVPVFPLMPEVSADVLRLALVQESDRRDCIELSRKFTERAEELEALVKRLAEWMHRYTPATIPDPKWIFSPPQELPTDEQYLLLRIQREIRDAEEALTKNRFAAYADVVVDLIEEVIQPYVAYVNALRHISESAAVERAASLLGYGWSVALRLLHPLMPGLTERCWVSSGAGQEADSIMETGWPKAVDAEGLAAWGVNDKATAYVEAKHDLLEQARELKHDYGLAPDQRAHIIIAPSNPNRVPWLEAEHNLLVWQLHADPLEVDPEFSGAEGLPRALTKLGTIYLQIEGRIDAVEELERLGGLLEKTKTKLKKLSLKLDNIKFIKKAPSEVVEAERTRRSELVAEVEKLTKLMTTLEKRGGGI